MTELQSISTAIWLIVITTWAFGGMTCLVVMVANSRTTMSFFDGVACMICALVGWWIVLPIFLGKIIERSAMEGQSSESSDIRQLGERE